LLYHQVAAMVPDTMIGGLKDEWTHGMLRFFSGVKAKRMKGVGSRDIFPTPREFQFSTLFDEPALIIVESMALIMR